MNVLDMNKEKDQDREQGQDRDRDRDKDQEEDQERDQKRDRDWERDHAWAEKSYRPDWAPAENDEAFAVKIVPPGSAGLSGKKKVSSVRRKQLSIDEYIKGVLAGDRTILARAITLIESQAPRHCNLAAEVLNALLPKAGASLRIGISGVPGAGKSTFIERFGLSLIKKGHKVAVLAVDPSSSLTKGSILGDKTRMEKLSRDENAFIRPSPSGGTLGGVAAKTREAITVCEAAGYDMILVETVGVGQSEITVRSMVDFFLLLQISGAGDELQGIKKGVIEIADAVIVNKADGDNLQKAERTRAQFETALHYLNPATPGWSCKALTSSALTGDGFPEILSMIFSFCGLIKESGYFDFRRKEQSVKWFFTMIEERMKLWFYTRPDIRCKMENLREKVEKEEIPATRAADELMELFLHNPETEKEK